MTDKFSLKNNDTFCIFPWIHLMVTPPGDVFPCCVSTNVPPFDKVSSNTNLNEIINNEKFKALRLDMLNGRKNKACQDCYDFEKFSGSWRTWGNERFEKYIEEAIMDTEPDGHINNFKMRYFDIRFRNICNFKCRTCGPTYSTAWQDEENKKITGLNKTFPFNLTKETSVLQELLDHVDVVDMVYFAGGEPLITDEHYIILEELIKKKKTHITIRYNTNCSILKYKNKDVLSLWKYFDEVKVSASIDHIGERAEYIRSGTDWGVIDTNLKKMKAIDNIKLSTNTVLSVFNYATLDMLYEYLVDNGLFKTTDWEFSLINTNDPLYYSSTVLPAPIKQVGTDKLTKLIGRMSGLGFTSQLNMFSAAINYTNSVDNWDSQHKKLIEMLVMKDIDRNESFEKTFPELKMIMENK